MRRPPASRGEAAVHAPLQPVDRGTAYLTLQPIPRRRVGDYGSAVERRAKHRRVRNLAAQSAADAGIDHLRYGLAPQRIGIGRERERWTPPQPAAGVIAAASVGIDAEALPHHAPALLQTLAHHRPPPPLLIVHAFCM